MWVKNPTWISKKIEYLKSDKDLKDKIVELESMINALITKLS